jgi:hypothetical protein
MPVARYFLVIGGVLLALLFVMDAVVPKAPVAASTEASVDKSVIRIHSDRKWPERVVFDTSLPTIIPLTTAKAEAAAVVPAPAQVSDVSAKVRVRDAFAQLPFDPKTEPKLQPKPQPKRKIAKRHYAPPAIQVAQQPHFGFFANNTW